MDSGDVLLFVAFRMFDVQKAERINAFPTNRLDFGNYCRVRIYPYRKNAHINDAYTDFALRLDFQKRDRRALCYNVPT